MQDWFQEAGLGMFIHWDHASQQGLEISWPLAGGIFSLPDCGAVGVDEYHASAATFDPLAWDARALGRRARACGMRYGVLTSKHHSGYALFACEHSDFGVMQSPCGRDLVAEYVEAMRAEGLRVGLYFSLSDWHHADYPPLTEAHRPYLPGRTPPLPDPERWQRFTDDMFAQLRHLLTAYGRIDLLWFDGGWERRPEHWRATELVKMIRELQPGILINDRLPGEGDFVAPEQFIPPRPPEGPWETCLTMNESWGWNPRDRRWKSARELVHALCEVVGRGGNLLLNVSPMGDGALPPQQIERLDEIARWMSLHAEAVHDTEPGLAPWQFYGPSTRRGSRVYLHLLMRPYDSVSVRGVKVKLVERVRALGSGRELAFRTRSSILDGLMPDPDGELVIEVPEDALDPTATVLAVDFREADS